MSVHMAKPEHEAAFQDIAKLLKKHTPDVSALDMLVAAANLVGRLVALQDKRVIAPKDAMDVIARNIEMGNEQMLRTMRDGLVG